MAMSKGELNKKAAEWQNAVDRIVKVREKALKTAAAAVDRKYRKQLSELLNVDGQPALTKELQDRIELPEFFTTEQLADDEVVDVDDAALNDQSCMGDPDA